MHHYKRIIGFISFIFFTIVLLSCDNKNFEWAPQIVAALGKGSLTINEQGLLQDKKYGYNVNALNSGAVLNVVQFTGTKTLAAFSNLSSTAAPYTLSNGEISNIVFDTLSVTGTITNPYAITFTQGMKVILRNTGQSQAILTHIVTRDITASGTSGAIYTFTEKVKASEIKGNFEVYFDNVSSTGTGGVSRTFSGNLNVAFSLGFNTIPALDLLPNISSSLEIIENFDLEIDQSSKLTGNLILNTTNSLPFNLRIQVSFLAADQTTVLTTLFATPVTISAGTVTNPAKNSFTVPADEILKQQASIKNIKVRADYTTSGIPTSLTKDTKLDFQIAGDLKIVLSNQ